MSETLAATVGAQLQRLLTAEPELAQRLQPEHETVQVVSALADAAQRLGLPLDADALQRSMDALRQIGQLIEVDPELRQALEGASSTGQALALIQRAAQQKGVVLDIPAQQTPHAGVRELADAELEPAVGGVLLTLGVVALGGVMMTALLGTTITMAVMGAQGKLR